VPFQAAPPDAEDEGQFQLLAYLIEPAGQGKAWRSMWTGAGDPGCGQVLWAQGPKLEELKSLVSVKRVYAEKASSSASLLPNYPACPPAGSDVQTLTIHSRHQPYTNGIGVPHQIAQDDSDGDEAGTDSDGAATMRNAPTPEAILAEGAWEVESSQEARHQTHGACFARGPRGHVQK